MTIYVFGALSRRREIAPKFIFPDGIKIDPEKGIQGRIFTFLAAWRISICVEIGIARPLPLLYSPQLYHRRAEEVTLDEVNGC
jgi:hypothetical protein